MKNTNPTSPEKEVTTASGAPIDKWAPDPTNAYGVAPLGDELSDIEAESGFWTSCPELEIISALAHERRVGRWALLGVILANVLSWAPPNVMLTDRYGAKDNVAVGGALNLFVNVVAESGDGKTRLTNAARVLVPPNDSRERILDGGKGPVDRVPFGTGEGLIKRYIHLEIEKGEDGSREKVMLQDTDTVVVYDDEGSTYIAELSRTGTKAAGITASMYSGQMVGVTAGSDDSRTWLPEHSYRLVLVMLLQPGICGDLFTEYLVSQGSPQRPLWLPGEDWIEAPVTVAPAGKEIRPLHWMPSQAQNLPFGGGSITPEMFPKPPRTPETSSVIWIDQPAKAKADIAAMDGARQKLSLAAKAALTKEERDARRGMAILRHSSLTRLKVMTALAFMQGRVQPTDHDWDMAGVAMRVCQGTLAYLDTETRAVRVARAVEKGVLRGIEQNASQAEVDAAMDVEIEETMSMVYKRLLSNGPMSRTPLYRTGDTSKRQATVKIAVERGLARGMLREDGHLLYPVVNGNVYNPTSSG